MHNSCKKRMGRFHLCPSLQQSVAHTGYLALLQVIEVLLLEEERCEVTGSCFGYCCVPAKLIPHSPSL
eukprot:3415619-Amphidinium_carterae.2